MDGSPFIKTEVPSLIPSKPPSLLPIPGREQHLSTMSQEKQQVQAAMAMAAFYSQSQLWQAAMARERLQQQQQQHATVPHPAAQAAAAAALSQLPGRPTPALPGLPGLAGMLNTTTTSNTIGGISFPGSVSAVERSRQDLFRDYLTKLAQSSLHVTTSLGAASSAPPQYLQSFSTSVADIKTENPLPASLRRSSSPGSTTNDNITSSTVRSPPLPLNYLQRDPMSAYFSPSSQTPYFGLQRHPSPSDISKPMSTTINRSPPSNGRRNGNGSAREKVFTCNVCNRSFGYKHVLQNHERTHTGEKPFECKECHKRFTRDHHLKTHMRLHTGEKPYSCTHCDRQFVQVANLRRHLRVHTGERPYKCELCPSNFSDSNQLKAHMLIHKGPSFNTLKEELLFRHSMAAGFPLPQYPPPPNISPPEADTSSQASMSPDSKETGSGDSPSHGENLSDSNSEKRRSRKQKPRKMIVNPEDDEGFPRERNVSSSSYHHEAAMPMQQEPEDLTIRCKEDDAYLAYRAAAVSDYSMKREPVEHLEASYAYRFTAANANMKKPARNRSEGSDGSLSVSDPQSAHSTPKEKFRSDDLEDDDDKDDDDRGVSPPLSHPSMYVRDDLFGGPSIQLGLSGAAVPISSREYMEKESEMLAMVAHKEISQQ